MDHASGGVRQDIKRSRLYVGVAMSAILSYGNLFAVVAEYERYVDYRVTDTTLNGWNYEPIFAARWVEPTEIIPAPRLSIIAFRPLKRGTDNPVSSAGLTGLTDGRTQAITTPTVDVTDVPEPGYSLLMALVLAVVCLGLRRKALKRSWPNL
jgi:hypothetical protein